MVEVTLNYSLRYLSCSLSAVFCIRIPCRHYIQALTVVKAKGLRFHIGLVRARWYQDPHLDITTTSTVPLDHVADTRALPKAITTLAGSLFSNPLSPTKFSKSPAKGFSMGTQTVPARTVFHEAQAAIPPFLTAVQTQEQLDALVDGLRDLQESALDETHRGTLHDPPRSIPREGHVHSG